MGTPSSMRRFTSAAGRRSAIAPHRAIAARLRAGGLSRLRDTEFLRALIVQTNNFDSVRWLGQPVWQNVLDLWVIQEAISELRPTVLLECGTNRGGSALFYANLFDLMGRGRVVTVDVERMHTLEHPRIDFLVGSSLDEHVLQAMQRAAAGAEGHVMVILDSDHTAAHVARELDAYHGFVTPGSLLLCQDGIIDELPTMTHLRPGPLVAIRQFLPRHPEFSVDARYNRRFIVTHHPDGWLRRAIG